VGLSSTFRAHFEEEREEREREEEEREGSRTTRKGCHYCQWQWSLTPWAYYLL
jgi:hypothetical protein